MNPSNPPLKIALIGNPNCGKTTIFNRLTGANQRVGNWSGVTVDQKIGHISVPEGKLELIDLPGIYAILSDTSESGIDEKLTCDYLSSQKPDCILNIVDAAHLERNLYLSLQLLEKNIPLIIIINRVDLLAKKGRSIDYEALSQQLGCPVFAMSSDDRLFNQKQVQQLKQALFKHAYLGRISPFKVVYPASIDTHKDADILTAQARYQCIEAMISKFVTMGPNSHKITLWDQCLAKID